MTSKPLRIIISGMVAGDPGQGGATWAILQYVLGLARLGHEVHLVEPIPADHIDDNESLRASSIARYFSSLTPLLSPATATLLRADTNETIGLSHEDLIELASSTDVLLNVSGMLVDRQILEPIARRVYLDLDPGFNQLWHQVSGIDMRFEAHTHFVTVGAALGLAGNEIPTLGYEWIHTLPPVVLDAWPAVDPAAITYDGLTTVANWRAYGSIEHNGRHYGQKVHSLRPLLALPTLCDKRFLPALAIHADEHDDLKRLRDNGWEVLDPAQVTATPGSYRQFLQQSWAELGVAKSGYVVSRSGWFSDRSACYLASGRPVIAQETGFSEHLATGEGLLAFTTQDDVLVAIETIRRGYAHHCRAARRIAEDHFDSSIVLGRLLEEVLGR